jgi:hypothetical protein
VAVEGSEPGTFLALLPEPDRAVLARLRGDSETAQRHEAAMDRVLGELGGMAAT